MVFDRVGGKLTFLLENGRLDRETRLEREAADVALLHFRLAGITDQGEAFLVPYMFPVGTRSLASPVVRVPILRFSAADGIYLGAFQDSVRYHASIAGGVAEAMIFSPTTGVAVHGGLVAVAHGDSTVVGLYDGRGGRLGSAQWFQPRQTATVADAHAMIRFQLDMIGLSDDSPQATAFRAAVERVGVSSSFPVAGRIVLGGDRLFVQEYPMPWRSDSVTWRVFDQRGRMETLLQIASTNSVIAASTEHLLMHAYDELSVPRVEVRRINGGWTRP